MKTQIIKLSASIGLIILIFSMILFAEPMGTAFTYQGRLLDANSPAEGIYDALFVVRDSPEGPNELGITALQNFEVFDGYFTVELDFGSDVFDGSERWLEIYVRPGIFNDPCEYTILWPRQKITPMPYALYAKNAEVKAPLLLEGSSPDEIILGINYEIGYGLGGISNNGVGVRGQSTSGTGVVGDNVAGNYGELGTPNYGVHGVGATAIFGESTTGVGVNGHSDVGDGVVGRTEASDKSGVYGNSTAGTGVTGRSENNYGVYGKHVASGNYGILGDPNSGVKGYSALEDGVVGRTSSSGKSGVYGHNNWTDNYGYIGGANYGVYGQYVGSYDSPYGYLGGVNYGVYGSTGGGNVNGMYGVKGEDSRTEHYGALGGTTYGVYGQAGADSKSYGYLASYTYGVRGVTDNHNGYGVRGGHSGSGNYGALGGNLWAGYFIGNVYVSQTISANEVIDRTPYPKDLATAYEAVMNMQRLPDGQYRENDKETQLDHSALSEFVRSEDGHRNLSATVSCHNEVLKDLINKQNQFVKDVKTIEILKQQVEFLHTQNESLKQRLETQEKILEKLQNVLLKGDVQ